MIVEKLKPEVRMVRGVYVIEVDSDTMHMAWRASRYSRIYVLSRILKEAGKVHLPTLIGDVKKGWTGHGDNCIRFNIKYIGTRFCLVAKKEGSAEAR